MSQISLEGSFVRVAVSPVIKTKIQIIKGKNVDTYYACQAREQNIFPLQYGPGLYMVKVYQLISKNKYFLSLSQLVTVVDTSECWLKPSQCIWYGKEVAALSDTFSADGLYQRLSAFFDYCYDSIHLNRIKNRRDKKNKNYISNISRTIKYKNGSCFDKAALFCALCRYNQIECQMVVGVVANKIRHAWCKVKVEGRWRMIDPTYGKQYRKNDYIEEQHY